MRQLWGRVYSWWLLKAANQCLTVPRRPTKSVFDEWTPLKECRGMGALHSLTLSPWLALPLWGKPRVEWRRQTQSPSVGAASEEQQHFKWRVSRHAVIHFSSATGFEARGGGGGAGSNWRLLTTNQSFQRQKVDGGRALEMRNIKNPLFTIDEQRAVNKVNV